MNQLATFCKALKQDFTPDIQNPSSLVRCWSEPDVLNREIVDAYVIILRTRGCSWAHQSGCSMCGYFNDSAWVNVSETDLLKQLNEAVQQYSGEKYVKIFTSGSFLDDDEIPPKVRHKILATFFNKTKIEKISVESRPEYITEKALDEIKKLMRTDQIFEIGIGLETANDAIREQTINKGFTFREYKQAALTLKKFHFPVKTYVLIKPLFLTEKEAINDSIQTVKTIKQITDSISFNPATVQRHTLMEHLWRKKMYRPPWLWSVIEILKKSKHIAGNLRLQCDIVGGGSTRGPHNCQTCDKPVLQAISTFSLTQDPNSFNHLHCSCKESWYDQLDLEPLSYGSLIDFSR